MRKAGLIIVLLAVPLACFAQEDTDAQEKIIGSAFKAFAKLFIMTADINSLKKENIDKLSAMDENKFSKRYAKVYGVIENLPPRLKASYGITEKMTKEQAIKSIQSLDKQKMHEIVDSVPDSFIARRFKEYLYNKKQEAPRGNMLEQVTNYWNGIMRKFYPVPVQK